MVKDIKLNDEIIDNILDEIKIMVEDKLKDNARKVILFGSCARGDYNTESDIDVAILTKTNRIENKEYTFILAEIATDIAMNYMAVVNFICIPEKEYDEKKSWYSSF